MSSDFEYKARWHATKVVLWLFSILGCFAALAYINIIALFILVAVGFVVMIAGAIYRDAYYDKLIELEVKKNEQSKT
jgi:uncharacterized protein (DUF58 family)